MHIVVYIFHTIIEMFPVSSSLHMKLLASHISESDMYAAHVPAAFVFAIFVVPLGIELIWNRAWHRLMQWCVCGIIADGITSIGYVIQLYYTVPQAYLYVGIVITGSVLMYLSVLVRNISGSPDPTYTGAAYVGAAQVATLIPGISRLALTYAVGRIVGWSHRCAFIFSCALVVPLYTAYGVYAYYSNVVAWHITQSDMLILAATMISAYAMLYVTYYTFAYGYAWIFALYLTGVACAMAVFLSG